MNTRNNILTALLWVSLFFLLAGTLFGIMHWPGGAITALLAKVAIGVLYPYKYMQGKKRTQRENLKVLLVLVWAITGVLSFYAEGPEQLPYRAVAMTAIIGWLLLFIYDYLSDTPADKETDTASVLGFITFAIAGILLVVGFVFKTMHWPGGSVLLVSGLACGAAALLVELFKKAE